MSMRPSHDPDSAVTALIDKRIGNAFESVRLVAERLREIVYLVANMEAVVTLAQSQERVAYQVAPITALESALVIPLPAPVAVEDIRASEVILVSTDGVIYCADSNLFTSEVSSSGLSVTVDDADPQLLNGEIRWRLVYSV
jgi:hypothetical protein